MARTARRKRRWLGILAMVSVAGMLISSRGPGDEPNRQLDARSRQFLLTGQEPLEPFVPLHPRTVEESQRLEAIKQFCIGVVLETEDRWGDAVIAYRKALENDPKSLQIYRALIKACRVARRPEEAEKYLEEAAELAPDDSELIGWLGETKEARGQIESAMQLYKQALASPKLSKYHPMAVILRLKLGTISEVMRNYDEAADYYRDVMEAMQNAAEYGLNMLESQPQFLRNRAETYERFSQVFRMAKRYDESLRALRLAQAAQPRSTRFSLNIAEVYIDQENFPLALEYLDRYLSEQTPQGSRAYERLAFVLEQLGREDEILPRVQAAAEKDRFNTGLQSFLGSLYEEAGQIDKAKEIYLPLLKNAPDSRVYKSMARIYLKEDRFRELIQLLGDGLEKQTEGRLGAVEAVDEQMKVLAADAETATRMVETAHQMQHDDPTQLKFWVKYFVALVARDAKLYADAIDFYRLCITDRPKVPGLHRELAMVLEYAGQTDEAIKEISEAVELEPSEVQGHFLFGQILSHAGRWSEAASKFEQLLQDFGDNENVGRVARYILSNVYIQLDQISKAEQVLEKILQRHPDDEGANNDLGYLWADQGKNLEQAEKMIRKALELYTANRQPDQPEKNAAYLDSMGWVLYKLGRPDEARKYLEQAVTEKEGSDDATIVDHLGDVYMRLKEPGKAKELWLKAKDRLERATGAQRDDKRLQEITEKLKALEDPKNAKGETRRDR